MLQYKIFLKLTLKGVYHDCSCSQNASTRTYNQCCYNMLSLLEIRVRNARSSRTLSTIRVVPYYTVLFAKLG